METKSSTTLAPNVRDEKGREMAKDLMRGVERRESGNLSAATQESGREVRGWRTECEVRIRVTMSIDNIPTGAHLGTDTCSILSDTDVIPA